MTVLITLTTAGLDSGPFNLYSNIDGYTSAFETGVSRASLLAGYSSALVPDYATIIRVLSTGDCNNYIDIVLDAPASTTTTTTATPSFIYLGTASTYATALNACSAANCAQPYYLPIPVVFIGQIIYNDPGLTSPYVGGNQWIAISEACNGIFTAVQVDNSGNVLATVSC